MKGKKKSGAKKWITIGAVGVAAVLVVTLVVPRLTPGVQAADISLSTATAETGSIEVTVEGSGSLSSGGTVNVDIPASLKVDEVLVSAGDSVSAGEELAKLNADSVNKAIEEARDSIDGIDSQIDALSDTETDSVTAPVAGRVKSIAVAAGSDLQQAVEQQGGIMVLSLDGKMKLTADATEGTEVGDEVTVTLADGTEKEGSVVSVADGKCTVTLTDNGPVAGETASVTNEDGTAMGSGTLEVNVALNVMGSGIAASIDVDVDEKVSAGDTLVTLSEDMATSEYQSLLSQRAEYEALLKQLYTYKSAGVLTAEYAGVVNEVSITATATTNSSASAGTGSDASGAPMSYSDTGEQVTPLSSETSDAQVVLLSATLAEGETPTDQPAEEPQPGETTAPEPTETPEPSEVTDITGALEIFINNPVTGNTPQTATMPTAGYAGSISWQPQSKQFEQQTAYAATVTLKANAGYRFAQDVQPNVSGAQVAGVAVSGEEQANTLSFTATFSPTGEAQSQQNQQAQQSMQSAATSMSGGVSVSGGSSYSGSTSGTSSASTSAASSTATDTSLDTQTALTLKTGSVSTLTISVDELDILSIAAGQEAGVVLDALPNETFTGVVDKISATGSSQSGVTTYPVTITLEADSRLMEGMNATATIVTDVAENIITIPMDALQETGDEKYVFVVTDETAAQGTEEEGENASMGERRQVETGISDGLNVEITSGLTEGEVVAYQAKTSEASNQFMMGGMAMGGGNMSGQRMEPPSGGMGGGPPQ